MEENCTHNGVPASRSGVSACGTIIARSKWYAECAAGVHFVRRSGDNMLVSGYSVCRSFGRAIQSVCDWERSEKKGPFIRPNRNKLCKSSTHCTAPHSQTQWNAIATDATINHVIVFVFVQFIVDSAYLRCAFSYESFIDRAMALMARGNRCVRKMKSARLVFGRQLGPWAMTREPLTWPFRSCEKSF